MADLAYPVTNPKFGRAYSSARRLLAASVLIGALPIDSSQALSLPMARERALASHPALESGRLEVETAAAEARAAAAFPDPEIGVDMENALGTGAFTGTRSLETTGRIAQSIPLGGKRMKRSRAADEELRLARIRLEAGRSRLSHDIGAEFYAGLRIQAERRLAAEARQLDSASLAAALERRAAGKAPPLEEERARIALSQARLHERETGREFETALAKLARMIGQGKPDFDSLAGSLEDSLSEGSEAASRAAWEASPAWQALAQRTRLEAAQAAVARAGRIPDLRVEAGVRHSNEAEATGFVFGISSPLPLWSRAAPVRAAESRVGRSRSDSAARALAWETRIADFHRAGASALETARSLKDSTLPSAERAFLAARDGFRMGRFSQLDVLESQRTLFEIRTRYLDALLEFHRNRITLQEGPADEQP